MRDLRSFRASFSAPDDVLPTTSSVSSSFIGSEQLTITLFERSPACLITSSTRDQCTASSSASASRAASAGVPARAARPAGLGGRPRARVSAGVAGESLELLPAARVAEHHLVPSASENRPELATHQTRTKNA